ncbi:dihydrodipicolinate reductase [Mycobacterium sp. MYCO198283]|uniref:NAD(P)H-dependent amine dehydrogenase family protein n=1 Tax=Mycobacterium sp. MYCO198283 TaxID=2883505 RepID=UPI001E2B1521|nr:dihydrodipicolinate reductase [Mycobacterium sp. MYCO198283]MCG5432431.1 dihydrodipicolinate reductase [Mycobacterium sp. MYCO198283]
MALRVIQWATGSVGRSAIRAILAHPELELVGCWVHSADKAGRDVGELLGIPPIGVAATADVDEILRADADAVVYAPLLPNAGEVAALLQSGKNVVTPVGWFYPHERESAPLEAACDAGQASLHGTGINPGGAVEVFPLMLSAMSSEVTFVRGEEFSDIRTYGAPDVVRHIMCFGGTREEAEQGPMRKLLTGGFVQSMRMLLDALGIADAEVRTVHDVAVATAPIDSPIGTIAPGQVAGQRFCWEAVVAGDVVARIGVHWLMGDEHLDPPWTFGDGGERYEIEVRGVPDTHVVIKGWQPETVEAGLTSNPGIEATAAHCVNAVPYVCAAAPGIVTSLDLPLVAGRAAARLR